MNFISYSLRVIYPKYLESSNLWQDNGYLQTTIHHLPLHSNFQQEKCEFQISQISCVGKDTNLQAYIA